MPSVEEITLHPKVDSAFRRINQLIVAFLAINIVFAAVTFLLKNSFTTQGYTVLSSRAVIFIVISLLLLFFHRQMVSGKRWAWVRLRVVSIAAPIGILVFLFTTQGVPFWADALQCIGALIYGLIAFFVNQEHMHTHFSK